jgi:8-oxo-dGTP pyrophosphatase MutT (NUDIX family)
MTKFTLAKEVEQDGGFIIRRVHWGTPYTLGSVLKSRSRSIVNQPMVNLPVGTYQGVARSADGTIVSPMSPIVASIVTPHYYNVYSPIRSRYVNIGSRLYRVLDTSRFKQVKNATIVAVYNDENNDNKPSVLLVQDKNNKWMTPGGRINVGEHPWTAAKREYSEEVNQELGSYNSKREVYYHSDSGDITQIFIVKFSGNYNLTNLGDGQSNETDGTKFISIEDLKDNLDNRDLKDYVKDSFRLLLKYNYL